jgi:Protein of unknown function (DUF2851)
MSEEFLQYIWKYRLFHQKLYVADTGEKITILYVGEQNLDAGPDFTDTRIRIGETLWAGNCEVHLSSSDWTKHNHENDRAYDSVILHVVLKNDSKIKTIKGRTIPTIMLEYNPKIEKNYEKLLSSQLWIPCAEEICNIERLYVTQWLTKLTIERLENRSEEIINFLDKTKNNWEEAFYRFLARSFGFKVNTVPFEMLSQSIPLKILAKQKYDQYQTEALLFGQAGLLKEPTDDYSSKLLKEYHFLQKKYSLRPIETHLWKFLRIRPFNFPTIRIAQFAALIHSSSGLLSKILEADNLGTLEKLFKVSASTYWDDHFNFGHKSPKKTKTLTVDSIHLLLVNAVIPFIFVYGKIKNIPSYKDKAISFLEELPPEQNSIIRSWQKLGVEPLDAFETQAMLQLKNVYCQKKKCLVCAIGNKLISKI